MSIKDYFDPLKNDFQGIAANQIINNKCKEFYKTQIDLFVKNKTVVDLGAGSGILSYLSVLAGAKKVYAVEKNKLICDLLKQSIKKLGWQDQIVVVNKDFVHDNLDEYFDAADVCVSEIINNSFTNNIFAAILTDVKTRFKKIKIIPNEFNYHVNIVENEFLDQTINWGYCDQVNNILDEVYLEFTITQPSKLTKFNFDKHQIHSSCLAIKYDFDSGTVAEQEILLPAVKNNRWLEIYWSFNDEIYDDQWQREYIPLSLKYFSGINKIRLQPNKYVHKIYKVL